MRKLPGLWIVPFMSLSAGCAPQAAAAPATPQALAGPITLRVDARDVPQMVLHAKVRIPARPGPLTLVYPKWIPGEHGPAGRVADISGLRFSAGGKALAWQRDGEQTSEFSVNVPPGSSAVDVELDVVVAARWAATADLSDINWHRVLLYPKGANLRDVQVEASAQIPSGWRYATALSTGSETAGTASGTLSFKPVSLETLVDSPLVMGRYGRSIDLGTALGAAHSLELVSDIKEAVDPSDKQIALYRRLVAETTTMFGARHYDKYSFLYMLSSKEKGGNGLEHHASSQNISAAALFSKEDDFRGSRWLLAHEFAHSWCGKYRRPKGLVTLNYQQSSHNELLWVYEGLTHYFGWLLATRSGLESMQDARDELASIAAMLDSLPGRKWRPLADTTHTANLGLESNRPWFSAQRSADYYPESLLIWLEADTIIRQKSGGKRSLDDFSRAFFGGSNSGAQVKPYELADVVKSLGDVVTHDWKGFFEQRVFAVTPRAPLGGIEGSGHKVVYRDKPTEYQLLGERFDESINERYSLGMVVKDTGLVADLHLDGPAARAGVPPASTLVAVNGRKYTADLLRRAIAASKGSAPPIELLTEKDGLYRTFRVAWNQGARYPHLERDPAKPDLLSAIVAPRVEVAGSPR